MALGDKMEIKSINNSQTSVHFKRRLAWGLGILMSVKTT